MVGVRKKTVPGMTLRFLAHSDLPWMWGAHKGKIMNLVMDMLSWREQQNKPVETSGRQSVT